MDLRGVELAMVMIWRGEWVLGDRHLMKREGIDLRLCSFVFRNVKFERR